MRWTIEPLKSRTVTVLCYKMTNESLYLDKVMFFSTK